MYYKMINYLNYILHHQLNMNLVKISISFSLFYMCSFQMPANAQSDTLNSKLETAKIGFISTKIGLTTNQAKVFWPVFEQYESKRKQIRKQIRRLRLDYSYSQTSDKQARQAIKTLFELRQQELDIEKLYCDKFLQIIEPAQVVKFYQAQKEFTKMLIKRLSDN